MRKRWFFALMTLVLFLGASEAGLRLLRYGDYVLFEPDQTLLWQPFPNQRGYTIARRRRITINAQRLRYREDLGPREPGELRVFTFGDSVTKGWGVDDDAHYSAILERLLRQRLPGRTVRVVSAGVNAYPVSLAVLRFERLLDQGLVPDVAVLAYSFNVGHEGLLGMTATQRAAFLDRVRWKTRLRRFALYNFVIEGVLRDLVYYRVRNRLVAGAWRVEGEPGAIGADPGAEFRAQLPRFGRSLERMAELAVAHDVELVLLLLGSQHQTGELNEYQQAFVRFAQLHHLPLVDQIAINRDRDHERLYLDHEHPTEEGHRLLAEHLLPVVATLGERRTHSDPALAAPARGTE